MENRKIRCRRPRSVDDAELGHFYVVDLQTAKKCTTILNAPDFVWLHSALRTATKCTKIYNAPLCLAHHEFSSVRALFM